jgi:general secretion pathway protein D
MIPFLGEIPGIGKLFSMTELADTNIEMFIFLTPRIISDDHEKRTQARLVELSKRPGDTPEFLHDVLEAKKEKKAKLMEKSLRMVLGRPDTTL